MLQTKTGHNVEARGGGKKTVRGGWEILSGYTNPWGPLGTRRSCVSEVKKHLLGGAGGEALRLEPVKISLTFLLMRIFKDPWRLDR